MLKESRVLDNGHVRIDDVMGTDLSIVNMARQSFGKEAPKVMGKKEVGLIRFLMRERHGTPFEGPVFTFNIKCPIFVAREWMRHRIGSFNEYSGRYSKMMSEFYLPKTSEMREQTGKPGAYKFRPLYYPDACEANEILGSAYISAWDDYERLIALGVAKEQARLLLPVAIYTQFSWVVNLRSLFNFISLRSDEAAMKEIRDYSVAIELMIQYLVPVAYSEFIRHGRVAP